MKFSITILLLIFSLLTFSQEKTTFELDDEKRLSIELKGKIKNIIIEKENIKNGNSENYIYDFNENGAIQKIVKNGLGVDVINRTLRDEGIHYVFKNGKLISKLNKMVIGLDGETYKYDENWNLVLEKHYMNNILVKEILQKFDNENRITNKIDYLYGGFSDYNEKTQEGKENYIYEKEEYEYDSSNNLTLVTTHNFRRNFIEERIFKFDLNGNIIEEGHCMKSNGKTECTYKPLFGFEYDNQNRQVRKFQLAQFSPHNTDQIFKYDNNGNKIESIGYYIYPNKEPIIGYNFKYEYNEFGNKTKDVEVIGKYRRLRFDKYKTEVTEYDKFQNIKLEEYLTESGTTLKVVVNNYEYDKLGNWIKKETKEGKTHEDLKATEITTREIEYYE
ncbi:hypothetical protein SAMN05428642_1192 [Flaviramulus basaltis]|uniref:YD repeat-containing protein n=1 Tax=Flaviramulus basaltis TaxID=369401 RepID=A0A1K2IS07_9FLAO|nr:hypothetical protein [Flaviramulus basaltis]SFZ95244.1 hypothetical protein SAMN05428642_1192 [Flaviramulus basaltis]